MAQEWRKIKHGAALLPGNRVAVAENVHGDENVHAYAMAQVATTV